MALFVSRATSESLRSAPNASVDFVVYFHGHDTLAANIIRTARLREMLVEAVAAVLVVPQLADKRRNHMGGYSVEMDCVSLEEFLAAPNLVELLWGPGIGRVIAGYSGGFQAAAFSAERGGVYVIDVYLFDAYMDFRRSC